MKLVVATYGTEGDTRPLSALCRGLVDAGHDVRLLAEGSTLDSATALGVPAKALSGDIKAVVEGDILAGRGNRVSRLAAAFGKIANANTTAWMQEMLAAAQGCDAILVSGLAAFAGLSVAEHQGVAAIGLGLVPITPTAVFPAPFLPPGLLPRWLNRPSHRLVNGLVWQAFRKATNAARAEICMLPPRRTVFAEHPMLYGISPSLLPRPADWPENARICGQWIAAAPAGWTPPEELRAFLARGKPPLYVGFGSMAGLHREALLAAVIAAVGGRRALFHPGWGGVDTNRLPDNFLRIGETPHDWLFPRLSLVIHHGGSGTAHSAARAGVPAVTVPFAGDQPFWADRLQRAGVAGPPVSARRLSAAALARGIEFAESPAARGRAAELGIRMRAENGVAAAIAAIEELSACCTR